MRKLASVVAIAAVGLSLAAMGNKPKLVERPQGCQPVAERASPDDLGCWITANSDVGTLPEGEVYWYIDQFPAWPTAEAAKGPRETVVESFGKVWLFTIGGKDLKSGAGQRVAAIGPLPVERGPRFMAQYMEATFTPGMKSRVHRHSGPEAWYTLEGEMCLESSDGRKTVVGPGQTGVVAGGLRMELTGTGSAKRKSLVLVLHDSSQEWSVPADDWTPKGLCQ